MPRIFRAGFLALASALFATTAFASVASAQMPGPPATVMGSIADSEGPVAGDVPVVAYIGDVECGQGHTYVLGEGDHQVTLYAVDVVSAGQTPGCGFGTPESTGAEIRLKVGDRFAPQKVNWRAGAVRLDLTFGDATPAPIPTSTPTPPRQPGAGPSGDANGSTGGNEGDAQGQEQVAEGTIPAGSPGAGSPVPTKRGGVTTAGATGGGGGGDDSGGFPVWGIVVLVLGGVAAIGGGVGFAMSRTRDDEDVDQFAN